MLRKAFTLIELLVVISIIGLLSSVVVASLHAARGKARVAGARQFEATLKHAAGDELTGEWLFENASNRFLDYVSLTTATCVSCPTFTSGYDGGTAASFPGGRYLGTSIMPSSEGTLSTWVKTTMINTIIIGSQSNTSGFQRNYLGVGPDTVGSESCSGGIGESSWGVIYGRTKVNDGEWHHCALSYDGSSVKLYVDGKLEYSGAQAGNPLSGYPYFIGGQNLNGSPTYMLTGALDDVRIYGKSLTASEVGKLYAESVPKYRFAEAE